MTGPTTQTDVAACVNAFLADRIFCMSSRPGRIIAERQVKFARPRDLDITYTGEFTDLVHDLRSQIASARQAA